MALADRSRGESAEALVLETRRRGLGPRLRKLLPWALAAAILALLFQHVPADTAWDAARHARLELFLPIVAVAVTLWFLVESRAFAYLFSRFNAPLSWAEARSLRALTYLLTPVNWNLGTAAIILHLRYAKGVGALESTSSVLLYATIDALVAGTLALVGLWMLPATPAIEGLRPALLGLVAALAVFLALVRTQRPAWGWLERMRALRVFRSHRLARAPDLAILATLRALYFAGFILFFWGGTRAFQVELPLGLALASTPVVLVAGGIPITPAGLGTQQAAMLYLYGPHGSEAAILAFALAFPAALIGARLPIGLLYLRDLRKLRSASAIRGE